MKIYYSPYFLKPKSSLSAKAGWGERLGTLLKIEWSPDLVGYADLHPHTELGDLDLKDQLYHLKNNLPTPLVNRSLHWALIDAHARKNQQDLFKDLILPKTHKIVTDLSLVETLDWENWKTKGYTHVKIKMGRDLSLETSKLKEFYDQADGIQWRLDFNESLSELEFQTWWADVSPWLGTKIDFIEDPTTYDGESWGASAAPLALDRALNLENLKSFGGAVVIFKPAISDTHWLNNIQRRVVFSNYMDHPFGEVTAIFSAAQHYNDVERAEVCGLRTWDLFEQNEFSESLKGDGPELSLCPGTGFGFDSQLKTLPWKVLL